MTRARRSLRITSYVLIAAALFTHGPQQVDPDLFWHLRVADSIEASGPRPLADDFSYNSEPGLWVPYSWLGALSLRALVARLEALALFLVPLAVYLATLGFLGLAARAGGGPRGRAGAALLAGATVLLPFVGLRPAALTFPLLAYAAWVGHEPETASGGRWRAAALVPVAALLANVHLFFLFVPLLLAARAAGEWLAGERSQERAGTRRAGPATERALGFAGLAVLAVAAGLLANPFGADVLAVAARYQLADVMVRSGAIVEMQPVHRLGPLVFGGTSLLLVWSALGLWRARGSAVLHLPLWILAFVLIVALGRYVPLAVMILVPLAARYGPWPALSKVAARRAKAVVAGVAIALVATAAVRLPAELPRGPLDPYLEARTRFPVAAARFVRDSLHLSGDRLINEMHWGGYLVYALWPRYRVLLDGRTQVYSEAVWRAAYVGADARSRAELFRRSGAEVAVLPRGSTWVEIIEEQMKWCPVYLDHVAGVWVPPDKTPAPCTRRAAVHAAIPTWSARSQSPLP